MRRPLCALLVLLALPCVVTADGFDDEAGAVLAQPLEPRPAPAALASMLTPPPPRPLDPVVRPAPAQPLPRVDLPAYSMGLQPRDRRGYALWKGEVSPPTDLPPDRLGILASDERLSDAVGAAPASEKLFVNVELELRAGGELKDAVADLSRGSGFSLDGRFPATRSEAFPDRVSVWGWLPSAGFQAASQAPSVRRLSASPDAHAAPGRSVSEMLVGIRMLQGPGAAEAVQRARRELSGSAGVVWRGMIGYQAVPGSSDLAAIFLAGVPIRSLSRVLEHPDVLKIAPAPVPVPNALSEGNRDGVPPPAASGPAKTPARESALERFFKFAAFDSPLLLVLTLLLAVPPLAGGAKRYLRRR